MGAALAAAAAALASAGVRVRRTSQVLFLYPCNKLLLSLHAKEPRMQERNLNRTEFVYKKRVFVRQMNVGNKIKFGLR